MKPSLYFDTSVFGGVFDEEFEEISILLFEKVKLGQIILVYSDLTVTELVNALYQPPTNWTLVAFLLRKKTQVLFRHKQDEYILV